MILLLMFFFYILSGILSLDIYLLLLAFALVHHLMQPFHLLATLSLDVLLDSDQAVEVCLVSLCGGS